MTPIFANLNRLLPPALTIAAIAVAACVLSCAQGNTQDGKEGGSASRLNEPGLIDVHAHIGEFRGYDLSLKTLLVNIEENNVAYALISNIDGAAIPGVTADGDEVAINEETYRVSTEHPKLKPLAWAKPGARGASADNIEPFLRDKKFLGIKFHPDFNSFAANSSVVVPYLKLCEKYRVPALFHCGRNARSNAAAIYEIARQFPAVPFILYHMGFGADHKEAVEIARQAKTKKDAIIYLETAQADAEAVLKAVEAVGADRVIFGTDAVYFGREHYEFYVPIIRALKQTASPSDFQKVIHDNAAQLFNLK